jgi:protein-disulfide isomerase
MRRGRFFSLLILIACILPHAPAAAECAAVPEQVKTKVILYAARKYHVDASIIHIASITKVEGSCFWTLQLTASSDRALTLYLSPDFHHLSPELFDLDRDPRDDERAEREKLQALLLTKRSAEKGAEKAKVTIVVFSDLQCPFCRSLNENLRKLEEEDLGRDVRIVFKNFPIASHDWSETAALIGECLREEDQALFWGYQDFVFAHQSSLSVDDLKTQSKVFLDSTHGPDISHLQACISDPKTSAVLEEDVELGRSIGVRSTPTFFVNGEKYVGVRSVGDLEAIVQEAKSR